MYIYLNSKVSFAPRFSLSLSLSLCDAGKYVSRSLRSLADTCPQQTVSIRASKIHKSIPKVSSLVSDIWETIEQSSGMSRGVTARTRRRSSSLSRYVTQSRDTSPRDHSVEIRRNCVRTLALDATLRRRGHADVERAAGGLPTHTAVSSLTLESVQSLRLFGAHLESASAAPRDP